MKRAKQIGIALMITACILLLVWLSRPAQADIEYTRYAAAAREVSAGTRFTADDVVMVDLPTGSLIADYYTSSDQIIGLASMVDISTGELLSKNQLIPKPRGLEYPFQPEGTRLMTIELPAGAANGFWLTAGSRVDIDMIARSSDAEPAIVSLENIEVVSVLPAGGMNDLGETGAVTGRSLICLALSRTDALKLAEGIMNRQINLSVICRQ